MSFISWQYAFLLASVVLLYWQLGWRGRIYLLLTSSYFFYGVWDVRFLALLLTSTAIDFYCGLAINGERRPAKQVAAVTSLPFVWLAACQFLTKEVGSVERWILIVAALFPILFTAFYAGIAKGRAESSRKAFLCLSIFTNLGVLFFFKYFNFFAHSLTELLGKVGWQPGWTVAHIILPVGISFYTFQSISYAVDIYRGKAQPARDYPMFAAYLAFFPQLVAGPIERPNDLLPQFEKAAMWVPENFSRGLRLILVGLFKKVFVADNCALVANYVFNSEKTLNAWWALIGVVAFAFQIYGDFSGYTDIARGSARLFGIQLNRNFHFPYFARGPSDFWQRWHITLSAWFRDYVYISLGGNRHGEWHTVRNLFITILLAGLWHGASWIFVLWGAYHGILLIVYRLTPGLTNLEQDRAARWKVPVSVAVMFTFTLFGWAIFRSRDLGQLTNWMSAFGTFQSAGFVDWRQPAYWLLLHISPLLLLKLGTLKARDEIEFMHFPWWARETVYLLLFLMMASSSANDAEFIYFQF